MEDEVLLNSLQNAGVLVPSNVSSIGDLKPATLVSICGQCLNLLDETASFPCSSPPFPDSLVDKFKICTDIALAIKRLGYVGDITYNKLLYPSEDDLYKLVKFLVERLSESSVVDLKTANITVKINEDGFTDKLKDISLNNVESELSDSDVGISNSASTNHLFPEEQESGMNAFRSKEDLAQQDEHLQDVTSSSDHSAEVRHETESTQNREEVFMEEESSRTSRVQKLEEELQLLKAAAEMAFDDQHPVEFYMEQIIDQMESRKHNIKEMELQWDEFRKPLEEKKISLEESLCGDIPEAQEKLEKLKETEQEKQSVVSEIRRRTKEHFDLSVDLAKQSGHPSRRSYIEKIKEIAKNSLKQDADIERILKETRELQLESNSIQDCLHRTYTVLDEIAFREAKKNPVGRQVYRLLTSIHECFEQISEKILMTDRTRREIAEYEKKLTTMAARSLNVDQLQANLDAIRRRNENLEQPKDI